MKLTFDQVSAAYQKKSILDSVSFAIESGSVTALIGRNGAGKSTLINCLMREKRDYSGRILLDDQDVDELSMADFARMVACLPQNLPRPHVTVRELVGFGRTPYAPITGRLSKADKEKINWAIQAVNMAQYGDSFVDTLSGGERKKAFFAMTLAQDTPVVILDEPTAHLDTISRFEFLELVNEARKQTGKTFLIVMHDLPDVLRCADRIVTLHERTVVFDGPPDQCLAAGIPQRCFQVRISGNKNDGYAVTPLK